MNYEKKYLKYKEKYLFFKNQYGGAKIGDLIYLKYDGRVLGEIIGENNDGIDSNGKNLNLGPLWYCRDTITRKIRGVPKEGETHTWQVEPVAPGSIIKSAAAVPVAQASVASAAYAEPAGAAAVPQVPHASLASRVYATAFKPAASLLSKAANYMFEKSPTEAARPTRGKSLYFVDYSVPRPDGGYSRHLSVIADSIDECISIIRSYEYENPESYNLIVDAVNRAQSFELKDSSQRSMIANRFTTNP
jgi:hypothetical protein